MIRCVKAVAVAPRREILTDPGELAVIGPNASLRIALQAISGTGCRRSGCTQVGRLRRLSESAGIA